MPVSSAHPLYTEFLENWKLCRDSYTPNGIKSEANLYLFPTSAHIIDGFGTANTVGQKAYDAYLSRAYYPDIFAEAVDAAIGIMHRKPPVIELPSQLESMRLRANAIGESLDMLLRRINTEQLITGRLGLLGDIKVGAENKVSPVVVLYKDKAIRNWDDISTETDVGDFRLVVLDETGFELQQDFSWKEVEKYLVLGIVKDNALDPAGVYQFATAKKDDELASLGFVVPTYKGFNLKQIPFTTVNACDLNPSPDFPPLIGLANLCLAIYRGEADYRHSLFMQGQDTLVKIGDINSDGEPTRVGAGACINVPMNGDAKFIGVNSEGLSEQRSSLENDYKRAYSKSGQITDSTSRAKESGDALRIRVAAQTATLPQIAMAGAMGLERVLKSLAMWLGADAAAVKVTPNLDFTNDEFPGKTLIEIVQAKVQGAPIANQTIHGYMRERNLTKLTYEEEIALIQAEEPML